MTDERTGAATPQAGGPAQPQVGASQAQAAEAQSSQADGADNAGGTVDVEALQRQLADSVKAERQLRAERQRLIDAQKAADDAKLPEQERLQRRVKELEDATAAHERERADWLTRDAVGRAALRLGFRDPVDAYALLDRGQLDLDDKGQPRNVDRLLTDLLVAKPYLGSGQTGRPQGSADGGTRGPAPQQIDMNAALRSAAGRGPRN